MNSHNRIMVYRCFAFGCLNSSSEKVSLLYRDPALRNQREKQVLTDLKKVGQ